ncbi:MAG TPA: N-acetylmuramoyl-L-alanine amidase [bacterium]|nr:N-acetylmuramoyl-L-alanine amidase [bacterium]
MRETRPTICLDPGHGGRDPGSVAGGLTEAGVALAIALAARRLLIPKYRVVLTRSDDTYPTLRERADLARMERAAAIVSIHVNAGSRTASGYEVFVRRDPLPESLMLAGSILMQFARRWPDRPNRGLKYRDLVVVTQQLPACLVECFFITNPADRVLLSTRAQRDKIAEAIAWGCGNFVRSMRPGPAT